MFTMLKKSFYLVLKDIRNYVRQYNITAMLARVSTLIRIELFCLLLFPNSFISLPCVSMYNYSNQINF